MVWTVAKWIDCECLLFELAYFSFVPNLLADTGRPKSSYQSLLIFIIYKIEFLILVGFLKEFWEKSPVISFIWRRLGELLNTKRKEVHVSRLPGTAHLLVKTLTPEVFHGAGW